MKWMKVTDVINNKTENYKNCIYMWRNEINGKLYVGKAKDFRNRTKEHKYNSFCEKSTEYNKLLHRTIRKYGLENFEVCILEKDLKDNDEMSQKEIYYIEFYDVLANKGKGYNVASGGEGGSNNFAGKTEEEMKEIGRKKSEAMKGKNTGENASMFGRTGADNPNSKAVICVTTGEIFSSTREAERQTGVANSHISACCRGKYKSAGLIDGKPAVWKYLEDYEKLSKEEINKIKNQETGRKLVICITTGEIYESLSEASRQTGVDQGSISKCCNSKLKSAGKHPETGEKLVWRYYEESL